MRRNLILTFALSVAASTAIAAEPTLESLQQVYKNQVEVIKTQHSKATGRIIDDYGDDLDRAIEVLKREGDPDKALAGIAEKKRFEAENTVPSGTNEKLPIIIQKCQESYRDKARTASIEKAKRFLDLTNKYVGGLDSSMRRLTAGGEFEQAVRVKQEKERVGFALAEVETKLKVIDTGESKPVAVIKLPSNLKRGLVLHYGFDKDEGDRVTDQSGSGNHGKAIGCRWVEGRIGGGFSFSKDKQYIDLGTSLLETESESHSMTIVFSLLPGKTKGVNWLISQYRQPPSPSRFVFYIHGEVLEYFRGGKRVRSKKKIRAQQWQTVAVTKTSRGLIRLYLDGEEVGSGEIPGAYADVNTTIGCKRSDTSTIYSGLMDDVMIWNRALSTMEMRQLSRLTGGK